MAAHSETLCLRVLQQGSHNPLGDMRRTAVSRRNMRRHLTVPRSGVEREGKLTIIRHTSRLPLNAF